MALWKACKETIQELKGVDVTSLNFPNYTPMFNKEISCWHYYDKDSTEEEEPPKTISPNANIGRWLPIVDLENNSVYYSENTVEDSSTNTNKPNFIPKKINDLYIQKFSYDFIDLDLPSSYPSVRGQTYWLASGTASVNNWIPVMGEIIEIKGNFDIKNTNESFHDYLANKPKIFPQFVAQELVITSTYDGTYPIALYVAMREGSNLIFRRMT